MAEHYARLAVGTVQWGMPYGVANRSGVPSDAELKLLIEAALQLGVDTLDTARAYGRSEERIGDVLRATGHVDSFRVVTKTSPDLLGVSGDRSAAVERLRESFAVSSAYLQPVKIHTLLLHRGAHRTALEGVLWAELKLLRERGDVARIGISATTPAEATAALESREIDVIQCAGSLLDQRLARTGFFEHASELGVEIHLRSVYLQGVAFLPTHRLPRHLTPCRETLHRIDRFATARGVHPAEVWLDYARSLPVTRIVIGAETAAQLRRNAERRTSPPLEGVHQLASDLSILPDAVLDPSRWPA